MNNRYKLRLAALLCGTIFTAPVVVPALAADAGVQMVANESSGIEQVMVTARRKEERLQDVPISISVESQKALTESNIQSVGDLQHFVPDMKAFGPYRDQPILTIRGQGGYSPGGLPSVILYINDVPSPTSAQAGSPGGALGGNYLFYDLENVQVVKGPQGTLFGRNTTGGAILVQSARPKDEFGGRLQVTAGNYDDKEFDGVINVPVIADKLLVRLAVNGQDRKGFTTAATPNHPGGLDLDNANHIAGRLSVQANVTSKIQNLAIIQYVNSTTHGTSSFIKNVNPFLDNLFPGVTATVAEQQALGIRRHVPIDVNPYADLNLWSATDTFSWNLSDNLTLRNIASYTKADYKRTIDGDGTVYPIFDPIYQVNVPYTTRQFTEEAQLQWVAADGKITGTSGYFYLNQPEEDFFTQHINQIFGGQRQIGIRQSESTSGLYTQADFDLSSFLTGLGATAGFRYTWETIQRAQRDIRIATGVCTNASADPATCVIDRSGDFAAPTWTVGLNYKVSPNTLVYVTSRRGFRSGGFNVEAGTPPADITVGQEFVTDVEAGVKSEWSMGPVSARTNFAAYRQYYDDIQLSQTVASPLLGSVTIIQNAGKAIIDGAEGEFDLNFDDRLEFGGNFGIIDFRYTKLNPGVIQPVLPTVPNWTYGLNAKVHLLRDEDIGHIYVSADYNWTDKFYTASLTDPNALQPAYGLLNVGATWAGVAGRPVDLSFFMTNALDQDYTVGSLPLLASVGFSSVSYGPPRMFGFRLSYSFGSEL